MGTEIKMPQLGESVVEGTITRWLKQEGDNVDEDELLVEVSTDKVDSEVPSSASGVLQKILVPEGETVKVGTPIAVIGGEGEAAGSSEDGGEKAEPEAKESSEDVGDKAEKAAAARTGQGEDESEAVAEQPAAEAKDEPAAEKQQEDEPKEQRRPAASGDTSKRGIISPLVRRLADEHGVELDQVDGTGTGGRIRKQDVLKFVETRKAQPAAKPAASAEPAPDRAAQPERRAEPSVASTSQREELVPWSNIRRRTAEHMVASAREVARAWNAVEADWSEIAALRAQAKDAFKEREGFGLTFLPFLARCVCDTLLEMPVVNATFDEENQGNRIKHYVNLGIAVALEGGGLIVPVVKAADEKNIVGLARGIHDVATRARSKKLVPDDLAGGSFTITNPGPFGSILSVPIIPRSQTAILGFEAIEKRVVVTDDDAIAIRSMGFLTMSWDHRVIDGAEAASFLAKLRERIETTDFSADLSQYLT
jgi:pyruvate dehydrogenase E2 component (dihydrolipoamide acetyltransferase)